MMTQLRQDSMNLASVLYPCLALFLGLMFLAGLTGCGPAPSDNAPNLGTRANVDGTSQSQQGSSPRTDLFIPAAKSVPPASGIETGPASGKGTVPGGDSPPAGPVLSS